MLPLNILRKFFGILICQLFVVVIFAQQKKDIEIKYTDSLELVEDQQILSNNIQFINYRSDTAVLTVKIFSPKEWKLAGPDVQTIKIPPYKPRVIPARFIRETESPAKWLPVKFSVTDNNNITEHSFLLKAKPIISFKFMINEPEIYVSDATNTINLNYYIKNTGNIDDEFEISSHSAFLSLFYLKKISLAGGQEYNGVIPLKITSLMRKLLVREQIRMIVSGGRKKTPASFFVNRLGTEIKQNISPYATFPLSVETGIMRFDKRLTYFFAFDGEDTLKNGSVLKYGYRTKQYGIANRVERNIFRLGLRTKKWEFYAGELSGLSHFYAFGQGVKVTHFYKDKLEIGGNLVFHNRIAPIKNDLGEIFVRNNFDKLSLRSSLSVVSNSFEKTGSFILLSEANLLKLKNIRIGIKSGVGQDYYMRNLPGLPNEKAGTLIGYDAGYTSSKINLSSYMQLASTSFPGVFSGSKFHNHAFGYTFNRVTVGLMYQYNEVNTRNLIFRDTIFNTSFFSLNMERIGLTSNLNFKKTAMMLSLGKFRQVTSALTTQLPSYKFADFSFLHRISSTTSFNIRTSTGYNSSELIAGKKNIWITNTSSSFDTKYGGLRWMYVKIPVLGVNKQGLDSVWDQAAMSFTPYVRFDLFSKMLNGMIGYTTARTALDDQRVHFLDVSVSYQNRRNGFDIRAFGNIPLSKRESKYMSTAMSNFTLSIIKKLNIPIIFKKKYRNLSLHLFKDANDNRKFDENELPVQKALVRIGNQSFVTDKTGRITYKNLPEGHYALDLTVTSAEKGLIPSDGMRQFPELKNKNLTYAVPYQKGKVIEGVINVLLDKYTSLKFSPEGLKVVVSDTSGNYYITRANEKGEFFVSVPAGRYKVSLNPEAFSKELAPEQMEYFIETKENEQTVKVSFTIKQKQRQINFIRND